MVIMHIYLQEDDREAEGSGISVSSVTAVFNCVTFSEPKIDLY